MKVQLPLTWMSSVLLQLKILPTEINTAAILHSEAGTAPEMGNDRARQIRKCNL